jgi:hypothetical protein
LVSHWPEGVRAAPAAVAAEAIRPTDPAPTAGRDRLFAAYAAAREDKQAEPGRRPSLSAGDVAEAHALTYLAADAPGAGAGAWALLLPFVRPSQAREAAAEPRSRRRNGRREGAGAGRPPRLLAAAR